MNILEAIQQMREGKKVCRSSECDGYCYFILGYEDNEYEERREIIYQYCAYHDFEKKHPQHKDRLVIQEWVFDIYDVEANDWIIFDKKEN